MECASCGKANRAGARFCAGCGEPLVLRCDACGAERDVDASFCDSCGTSFAASPAQSARGTRKVVTVVFTDLAGSTSLHERTDAEPVRRLMEQYYAAVRAAIEMHRGSVVKLIGDGVMAVFGVPHVAEDDALHAVQASVAAQAAFTRLAAEVADRLGPLSMRVGVNTGEVVVSDADDDVVGDPVNVAARLEHAAPSGGVLIGEATRRLVHDKVTLADAGELSLKGRADPVPAYRVVSLQPPDDSRATVFVGRDSELERLMAVYHDATGDARARLAMVIGSPGLGKSRLLAELTRDLGTHATVLFGRCDHAGGATFAPVADALRLLTGLDEGASGDTARTAIADLIADDESERERIVTGVVALFSGSAPTTEEAFWSVRRFLAALARRRPVVLALDDLHWAEPLLLDLMEHIVEWSGDVPLFVLGAARPELREARSSLTVVGRIAVDVVTLDGLDARAATRLAADVIGTEELPAGVAGHVLAASEGNPLFVRELVRMLVDDGAIVSAGDRWVTTVELAEREMPPTIHALLAARIERLRADERTVLERASVIGKQFSSAALEHLLPANVRADLSTCLEGLRRRELIERDAGWFLGDPVYRFHHVLIRDAAYRRLLKGSRAELHMQFAEWLELRAGDALSDHDETLGWHLEQAYQHLRELGPVDERGHECGARAARHLATAGRRALARDDIAAAAAFLGRALASIEPTDDERAELVLDWCEALLAAGDVNTARTAIDDLAQSIDGSTRLRAWHACFAGQLAVLTAPQRLRETADAVSEAAVVLAAAGDDAGEAKAHWVHSLALSRLGEVGASEAALDRALAAARKAGDRRRANAVLAGAPLAALAGPSPVTRASGRCLDVVRVLRITAGAPAVEAVALRCQAVLEALRGRTDAARRMIGASRRIVEDLGVAPRLLETEMYAGMVELIADQSLAAEDHLRAAYDGLRSRGLRVDAAQAAALLGRALLDQGRAAEAEALSHESEELAGDDLKAGIAWRGVRAEALAQRGEHTSAVQLARDAVALASATDALLDHADARVALAVALRAAGRADEAVAETDRAIELWDAKGATLLAGRARDATHAPAEVERAYSGTTEISAYFSNLAARMLARGVEALNTGDWPGFASLVAPEYVLVDRRRFGTGEEVDREHYLATSRDAFEFGTSWAAELIATRGQHLSLHRLRWTAARRSVGTSDEEFLTLDEVDEHGQLIRTMHFDVDDLDAAYAELDARAGEDDGTVQGRAVATQDWAALRTVLADDHVLVDYRPLGWGTLEGPDAYIEMIRGLAEITHDLRLVTYHRVRHGHHALSVAATKGRGEGGPFENPLINLREYDDDGRIRRHEMYALDEFARARARFESLYAAATDRSTVETHGFDNAATDNIRRFVAAFGEQDWDGMVATIATDAYRYDDYRGLSRVTLSGKEALHSLRVLLEMQSITLRFDVVATRGERLELSRVKVAGADKSGGRFEEEHLALAEVDASGRIASEAMFDLDDVDAAYAEMEARYVGCMDPETARIAAAGRAHARALATQDWAALAEMHAPDIVVEDHRPVGWGTLHGVDAYLGLMRSLGAMSRDLAFHVHHRVNQGRMMLVVVTLHGEAEGGPFEMPTVGVFERDNDGRLQRWDVFGVDQLAEAKAQFEAAVRTGAGASTLETHGFANKSTENLQHFVDACAARDWPAVVATMAERHVFDDRRALDRFEVSAEVALDAVRVAFDNPSLVWNFELLASRGSGLALFRLRQSGIDRFGGRFENDHLSLSEVDDSGRRVATILFGLGELDAAYEELDARFLAGEGAPFEELLSLERRSREAMRTHDIDTAATLLSDDFTRTHPDVDGPIDRDTHLEWLTQSRAEFGVEGTLRVAHIIRLSPTAGVAVMNYSGALDGGAFEEDAYVAVFTYGEGRFTSFAGFELHDLDTALARYDEITRRSAAPIFENAATRSMHNFAAAWNAHDWDAVVAVYAPSFRLSERRSPYMIEMAADEYFASTRAGMRLANSTCTLEILATRGERLCLTHDRWLGASGTLDTSEVDLLGVIEVDHDGLQIHRVSFDANDLDAAYEELDNRYAAGEAAGASVVWQSLTRGMRAYATDSEALEREFPAEFSVTDHRPLGWGTLDRASYLDLARATESLSDARRNRVQHALAVDPRGAIIVSRFQGVADGAPFELSSVIVSETRRDGRPVRLDFYAVDRLDDAWARYHEITRRSAVPIFENQATRSLDRFLAAWNARDWEAFTSLFAPEWTVEERQHTSLLEADLVNYLSTLRTGFSVEDSRWEFTVLATRGQRLVLSRARWTGAVIEGASAEIEYLALDEVDDEGRKVMTIGFAVDDLDAAYDELDDRFAAAEAAGAGAVWRSSRNLVRTYVVDVEAMERELPPGFWAHNHRALGWGTLDRATYLDMVRTTSSLSEKSRTRMRHVLAVDPRGMISVVDTEGVLADGGLFELSSVIVAETLPDGRPVRMDFYALDSLDDAWARYHAIINDRVLIPPNAATRASDRNLQLFERHDWDALRELLAEGMRFDDRRNGVVGDRETVLASYRLTAIPGATIVRTLLATAGDRLALERTFFLTGNEGAQIEVDTLSLNEVDAEGRITAIIAFNVDDRRAANDELNARFAAGGGGDVLPPVAFDYRQAVNEQDLEWVRALVTDDCVLDDRRRVGLGRIDGRDALVDTLAVVWAQAPDAFVESIRDVAVEPHGFVTIARLAGRAALHDTGAFESVFVSLTSYRDGKLARAEMYEPEELDVAVRRLAELRPDPLQIPPNAATRAADRHEQLFQARDWEAVRELFDEAMLFEDRRNGVVGDRETMLASNRLAASAGAKVARTLLATAGDRLALEHYHWDADDDGANIELDTLSLTEVNAEGRITADIAFNVNDRAANDELNARFAAGEGEELLPRVAFEFLGVFETRDLERARTFVTEDYVLDDRRRLGMGRTEGRDAYVETLSGLWTQAPDIHIETVRYVAIEPHGFVTIGRLVGRVSYHDSVDFESLFVRLIVFRDGMVARAEMYEPEDLGRALQRLGELKP